VLLVGDIGGTKTDVAVVTPEVGARAPTVYPYERGSWGPPEADRIVERHGGWHNPAPTTGVAR
jgi:hypothetical protein